MNNYTNFIQSIIEDPNGVKMPEPISKNFDRCLDYINSLLKSSINLAQNNQTRLALFVAITAVEETTKAEIYCFRVNKKTNPRGSKDSLKKHDIKHKTAVNKEVLLIGKRVQDIIGKELTEQIYDNFSKGKTRELRESCLYFEVKNNILSFPNERIDNHIALAYLLACIEIIDDKLVGWTNYSFQLSGDLDRYFEIIKDIYLLNL